jgi:2-dehydropantoate 2-reductase
MPCAAVDGFFLVKIAVVGCGAMGSVYAVLFSEAGHDVRGVDSWPEHVKAIRENGLWVEGASGDRLVGNVDVSETTDGIGLCDLVIVATKASGVSSAASSLGPLLGPDTAVITIQNGLGSGERIAQNVDPGRVVVGVAEAFGASVLAPGRVHHNSMKLIRLGELHGGMTKRLEELTALWSEAGFTAKCFEDINQLVWEKFVCNVAFSGPCTVFERTMGEMLDDSIAWGVVSECAAEAYRSGIAQGVNFSYRDPEAYVREFGERMPRARPSMLLDHMAKRRSEIDAINGMVPVVAREVGTQAPYNEVVSEIVRSRELEF